MAKKQNRRSGFSFLLLGLIMLACINWLWQMNDRGQVSYYEVKQLLLQLPRAHLPPQTHTANLLCSLAVPTH